MPIPKPSQIVVATGNPHKLGEIRSIMVDSGIEVIGLDRYPDAPEVVEDRDTLRGNAAKKAETIMHHTGLPALADDTGLEVDALGGAPGVYSARYAGEHATAEDNRRKLLDALQNVDRRSARFRTVIALARPDGTEFFDGVCEGRIIRTERGEGGFGYDPIFVPDGFDITFAEMDADAKNAISHRGRALQAFAARFGLDA